MWLNWVLRLRDSHKSAINVIHDVVISIFDIDTIQDLPNI